ncbi:MAG: glycosyltransferase family 2 protein [Terriglobales bacterium]
MKPPLQLSLVVPTWNGRDLLARFLPSLVRELTSERELVISDDGSTDGTAAWLPAHYPIARVIRSERNRGFAPAANAGVAAARAEIVVLLNSDIELTPACLDPIPHWFDRPDIFGITLRAFDLPEKIFSTGGKLGHFRRGFWEAWRNYAAPSGPSFMLAGGFCAFRRSVFLDLGGFDPIFAPYYSEDLDLSYRARKRGWQLGYEPSSLLYHQRSSSVNRHQNRFRRQAIIERNRLLFHWRNLDLPRLAAHLLWAHLLLLQMALKGNWAYHAGYAQALARSAQVRRFRLRERPHWRLHDHQLELAETLPPASASSAQGPL